MVREELAGTGMYEGMVTTGTAKGVMPEKEIQPGVTTFCNQLTGTYKMKCLRVIRERDQPDSRLFAFDPGPLAGRSPRGISRSSAHSRRSRFIKADDRIAESLSATSIAIGVIERAPPVVATP